VLVSQSAALGRRPSLEVVGSADVEALEKRPGVALHGAGMIAPRESLAEACDVARDDVGVQPKLA
jgi:hypothetical protein